MALTPDEYTKLLLTTNITSGLSLAGGLWIFFVFITTWELWTHSGKMILFMNMSYFLYTISNLLSNLDEKNNAALCNADAFIRTFAIFSAFYWAWKTSQIAYYSLSDPGYRILNQMKPLKLLRGFLIPIIVAAIPLIGFSEWSYGYLSLHCGIKSANPITALITTVIIDVLPPFLCLVSSVYYSFKIIKFAKSWGLIGISPMRLLVYSFGLALIWIPSMIHLGLSYLTGQSFFWLQITKTSLTHSLGFIHAIIYGVQTIRLSKIKTRQQSAPNVKALDADNGLDNSFELTRSRTSIEIVPV